MATCPNCGSSNVSPVRELPAAHTQWKNSLGNAHRSAPQLGPLFALMGAATSAGTYVWRRSDPRRKCNSCYREFSV